MKEMSIVAEAVSKAFYPEKMNYELLGMGDAHLHWHLFPRRQGILEILEIMGKAQFGGIQWKKCTMIIINFQ